MGRKITAPLVASIALVAACAGSRRVGTSAPQPVTAAPPATVRVGECANPERDGVVGQRPRIERADRDLDGDGATETVRVDRNLCTPRGNCWWNVFSSGGGCPRYLGTVAAQRIEKLSETGDDGFHDLRGWWRLTGGDRLLLQQYHYRHGGYRVVQAMVCKLQEDDRVLCAEEVSRGGADPGRQP